MIARVSADSEKNMYEACPEELDGQTSYMLEEKESLERKTLKA